MASLPDSARAVLESPAVAHLVTLNPDGSPQVTSPAGDESFRSHWLSFPVAEFLHDGDPAGPPLAIEIQTGDRPTVIEVSGGQLRTRPGPASSPDLVLNAPAPLVLGVLTGQITLTEAEDLGLRTTGNRAALRRLRPRGIPAKRA